MLVEVKNLKKTYTLGETQVPALRGVNLKLAQGEFSTLIGASGSGKSTLLNLIGSLDVADEGDIFFEGRNLSLMNEADKTLLRNQKIGFIFQSFNLLPVLNVLENVEMPLLLRPKLTEKERRAKAERSLADVGLADFKLHLPDQLSGGQRQRVAIARALVSEPSLILADEPTANLDSKTANMIIDLLLQLNKQKKMTFFFCSHDETLISRVSRVIRISDGIIMENQ